MKYVLFFLFFIGMPVYAQESGASVSDYWPHVLALLLAVSELLAVSPLKSNGIVDTFIKIAKALAGK